jgi:UDP-N-acetylglucosamine:LPS N-acetylglucosamine transferase
VNVTFCSSSVGCGHTRASVAIHDALRARGQLSQATFIEALEHAPRWFSTVYRDGYLRAIRHAPRVVGAIYNSTDIPRRDRRPLGPALDRFEDRIMANFRAHPGLHAADVVVSTHFLTSALLGRMRLRGELQAPVVTVVTDEHPHAVWLHRGVDLTCVASRAARTAAIAGGMDPARVEVTFPLWFDHCLPHHCTAPSLWYAARTLPWKRRCVHCNLRAVPKPPAPPNCACLATPMPCTN